MAYKYIALIFLLVAGALPSSATGVFAVCITADCHATLGQAKVVHAPVAAYECEFCHKRTGRAHPGDGSMEPVAAGRDLCLNCHADPIKGQLVVHSPVAESCTDCHDPHQSANSALLLLPDARLCLNCHDSVARGEQVHGPVASGKCSLCHAPHASPNPALMLRAGNESCLACHVQIEQIIRSAKSQHQPVAAGRCWECHTPHSSDASPLLRAYYPVPFYESYAEGNYALCFSCHDKNAFEYERTSEATNFRNRDQNLHFFHVNRPVKGRVCKSCHGVHGADQGKLLVSDVPHFGNWEIPLRWVPMDNGAACYVGCHRPKMYDRQQRINNL